MSDLAKLSRWAVPGAVVLFSFFGIIAMQRVLPFRAESASSVIADGTAAAVVALSGLPLGALTYQIYFFLFSRYPRLLPFVHRNIGLAIVNRSVAKLPRRYQLPAWPWETYSSQIGWIWLRVKVTGAPLQRRPGKARNDVVRRYYERRERAWRGVEFLITQLKKEGNERALDELGRLSEIYHTLGATRLALVEGLVAGVIAGPIQLGARLVQPLGVIVAIPIAILITAALYWVVDFNRTHTLERRRELAAAILDHNVTTLP